MVRTTPRNPGRAQPHQHLARGAELDDLVPACSFGCSCGTHRVGHPDITVRVHVDSVRPDEHAASEALHDVAFLIELQNRIQVGIQALVAEPPGFGRITPDDSPDMLAVGIDVDPANGTHLPSVGQCGPVINGTIWIR